MNNCFILLAAGQSKRFKSKKQKQFTYYKGKLIYEHSVDKVLESGLFDKIIVVSNIGNISFNLSIVNGSFKCSSRR